MYITKVCNLRVLYNTNAGRSISLYAYFLKIRVIFVRFKSYYILKLIVMVKILDILKELKVVKVLCKTKLSQVYKVRHVHKDRYYVLKVVDENDKNAVENIEKEIYIYETLPRFKYILKYYGHIRTENKIIMLLEYAEKGDMWNCYLKQQKPITQNSDLEYRVAKHIYQLCDALKFIHSHGIVHADIKIENVLLDERDNVKLCDFGLSFVDRSDYPEENDRRVCGTIGCLSPELCIDTCPTTKRLRHNPTSYADVWALGVLLYEIYYHKSPFVDPSEENKYYIPTQGLDAFKLYNVLIKLPKFNDKRELREYSEGAGSEIREYSDKTGGELRKYFIDILKKMFRKDPDLRATLRDVQSSEWMRRAYLEPSTVEYLNDD